MRITNLSSAASIVLLAIFETAIASPERYSVVVLPVTPGCQSWAILHGISASGHLQGMLSCDDFYTWRGIKWDDEGFVEIGTFGGPSSYVLGLNARGDSVGYAETPELWAEGEYISRAFLYRDGMLHDLGTLGGPLGGAIAINESGAIVGASQPALKDSRIGREPIRPCIWMGGAPRDLGDLGGPEGGAYDINSRGWIVGSSNTAELLPSGLGYVEHAFLYNEQGIQDLGTLGGLASIAFSLNERGDVVGWSFTGERSPDGRYPVKHAFLWSQGLLSDLGTLGGVQSEAEDINDRGQIVGWSSVLQPNGNTQIHAVLWDRGGIVDLNEVVDESSWSLQRAVAIDNRGRILVNAIRGFEWRAVLLTPTDSR